MTAIPETYSYAAYLECPRCKTAYNITSLNTFATCCNQPLGVKYDDPSAFYKEDLVFRDLVEQDAAIRSRLPDDRLRRTFQFQRQLANVDAIFDRVLA